jgi:hypothetical protein
MTNGSGEGRREGIFHSNHQRRWFDWVASRVAGGGPPPVTLPAVCLGPLGL